MSDVIVTVTTPEELLPLWLQALQVNDHASGTIRRYNSAIESFLSWYEQQEHRPLTVELLTPVTLVGYRNFLQRTQGRATSTVNGHMSALRAWCAWLTEQHYLEVSPAKSIKLVCRQEASSREGLSDTQVNALVREVRCVSGGGGRKYAIVQLLLQTGMRLDECSHLNLEDIEFGERSGRVTIRHGKGNKARTVPLNTSARQAFAEYLALRFGCDSTIKALALAWPHPKPHAKLLPLWRSHNGRVLTTSAMRQMIDVVVRDAAVRGLVPAKASAHTLRHTFAHNYLSQNPSDVAAYPPSAHPESITTPLSNNSLHEFHNIGRPPIETEERSTRKARNT